MADPTRQRILELLAHGELSAGEIAAKFPITPPAISQHLKVLKEARLVKVKVAGQHRIYDLDRAGFAELQAWLDQVTHFWHGRLDRLEDQLRSSKRKEPHDER